MRISSYDVWIIKMGTVYLMAVPYIETKTCRLSENIYDAARFDDEELAVCGGKQC